MSFNNIDPQLLQIMDLVKNAQCDAIKLSCNLVEESYRETQISWRL
jgi:hypothetical protein